MTPKTCTKCLTEKPCSEFTKHSGRADGLATRCRRCIANYIAENREKLNAGSARYYAANRERAKATNAQYRAENHEKLKAAYTQYRAENREKLNAARAARYMANHEKEKDMARARSHTFPSRHNRYKNGAKQRGITFLLSVEEFSAFWQVDCHYCGGAIATIGLDRVDSSKGYEIGNVVPCCAMCNRIKLDHDLDALNDHMLRMLRHQGVL